MPFSIDTHWVWDFWLADDGERFHLYYLHAPRSLGDERLRHRNARIGHAVSTDLRDWSDLGPVIAPGSPGEFDETATWTGSVVRADDGEWWMFYTGSRFPDAIATANIESIGAATSRDLHHWTKRPGPVTTADPRWYETFGDGTWREEAWRDPWVFRRDDGWHMIVTARARSGDGDDRGIIGHAVSDDLATWRVAPALSAPGAGFVHLEVLQFASVDGHEVLLFSCDAPALAGSRAGQTGGIWWLPAGAGLGDADPRTATLLASEDLYAGRIVRDRTGKAVLLAFENGRGAEFMGRISDPIPLRWDDVSGAPELAVAADPA